MRFALWTIEQDNALRGHALKGLSAGQISECMGKTRNSVIGRMHRIGVNLSAKRPGKTPYLTEIERKERHNARQRAYEQRKFKWTPKQRFKAKPSPVVNSEAMPIGLTIMQLQPDQCRYVMGDVNGLETLYCAVEKHAGSAYCGHHHRLCHYAN